MDGRAGRGGGGGWKWRLFCTEHKTFLDSSMDENHPREAGLWRWKKEQQQQQQQ